MSPEMNPEMSAQIVPDYRQLADELGRGSDARSTARARLVLANGCFDVLHVGHVRLLRDARALGDVLVVALNSDASVRRNKGAGRPIVPARQRAEVLAALACVDWVVLFAEPTPRALIRALGPDVLAKGGDWALDAIVGRTEVEARGGKIVRLREIPGVRTTELLERARRRGVSRGRRSG